MSGKYSIFHNIRKQFIHTAVALHCFKGHWDEKVLYNKEETPFKDGELNAILSVTIYGKCVS